MARELQRFYREIPWGLLDRTQDIQGDYIPEFPGILKYDPAKTVQAAT